jgi:hypothetical protein
MILSTFFDSLYITFRTYLYPFNMSNVRSNKRILTTLLNDGNFNVVYI